MTLGSCRRFAVVHIHDDGKVEFLELVNIRHPDGVPCDCPGCQRGITPSGDPIQRPARFPPTGFAGGEWQ